MSSKKKRVIGTTHEAIDRAENELGFKFPPSFRFWLVQNNGLSVEDISIFPVFDERDPRKTWDSIVRNYNENWLTRTEYYEGNEFDFSYLLPFAEFGTGDYYCFDYSEVKSNDEIPVVVWWHETGKTELRGENFDVFLEFLKRDDFDLY